MEQGENIHQHDPTTSLRYSKTNSDTSYGILFHRCGAKISKVSPTNTYYHSLPIPTRSKQVSLSYTNRLRLAHFSSEFVFEKFSNINSPRKPPLSSHHPPISSPSPLFRSFSPFIKLQIILHNASQNINRVHLGSYLVHTTALANHGLGL